MDIKLQSTWHKFCILLLFFMWINYYGILLIFQLKYHSTYTVYAIKTKS